MSSFSYDKHQALLNVDSFAKDLLAGSISMLVVRQKLRPEELYSFP